MDGVSFDVHRGETLGLVGESGCGKSTCARTVVGLYEPTAGSVTFDGTEITGLSRRELRAARRRDPDDLPGPGRVPRSAADGRVHPRGAAQDPRRGEAARAPERAVSQLLDAGGAARPAAVHRFPHEFSGGQRQRIGVARALAMSPT